MDVPLLTVEQVNRVVKAGFHVYGQTPTGIIGRVLAAREGYTRHPPPLPPGVTVGPDVPQGVTSAGVYPTSCGPRSGRGECSMHRPYPASPIPDGQDMAGNYHDTAIAAAHTADELADFNAWMNGQTMIVDDQGRTVIFARDYERWADRRRSAR